MFWQMVWPFLLNFIVLQTKGSKERTRKPSHVAFECSMKIYTQCGKKEEEIRSSSDATCSVLNQIMALVSHNI